MRILVLNFEYPPIGGGAAPVTRALMRALRDRGHELTLLTMAYGDLPREEREPGLLIRRTPCLRRHPSHSSTFELATWLFHLGPHIRRAVEQGGFDCLHAHFLIPTGLAAVRAKSRYRLPLAITAHGSDVPGFNRERFTWEHRFTTPLLRKILHEVDAVVTPSNYLKRLLQSGFPATDPQVIPNGIFSRDYANGPKQRGRILMAGRLLERKGFHRVLAALHSLDRTFDVDIVGDGPYRRILEQTASRLPGRVRFHGWLAGDSAELRGLYSSASIFALPSESENASVALLEAMASGCAIVTADTAGCPETTGDAALLVNPGDGVALREAFRKLLDGDSLCAELGSKAMERSRLLFDWQTIAFQYETLFARMVKKSRG